MVVFYKYIYTEILLCRLSWGSVLQFRTLCFLDPTVFLDELGLGIMSLVRRQSGKEDTYIYSPLMLLPQALILT